MVHVTFRYKPKTRVLVSEKFRQVEAMFQFDLIEQEEPAPLDLLSPITVVQEWARHEGRWIAGRVVV